MFFLLWCLSYILSHTVICKSQLLLLNDSLTAGIIFYYSYIYLPSLDCRAFLYTRIGSFTAHCLLRTKWIKIMLSSLQKCPPNLRYASLHQTTESFSIWQFPYRIFIPWTFYLFKQWLKLGVRHPERSDEVSIGLYTVKKTMK